MKQVLMSDNYLLRSHRTMNYISQTALIEKISQKILQPKQSQYNEQAIFYALSYLDNYQYVDSSVYNKYNEKLKVSLFFNRAQAQETCILYMHGYGSNRVEGVVLLRYLPSNISLCCFDFSAEGKSEGRIVTYGQKQKDDIKAILGYLRTCGYTKFILWGRSMGATCTLLFTMKQKPKDVILQILDSPFISFTEAALQLTKKRVAIPEVLIKLALQAINTNLSSKQYNPFEVDLNCEIYCDIPTIFIYSENDQVIGPENSFKIIKNFRGYYEKLVISESHNATRRSSTIKQLISIVKKYLSRSSLRKKQNQKQSPRLFKQYASYKGPVKNKQSFENYGIELSEQSGKVRGSKGQKQILHQSLVSLKRPKSSIKVFSSYLNIYENNQNRDKLNSTQKIHRLSYSRPMQSLQKKLSHEFYL